MEFSENLKKKILGALINNSMSFKQTVNEIVEMNLLSFLDSLEYSLQNLIDIQNEVEYKLSDNQLLFIHIALKNNLELSYDYSGRGMFGEQCPSIVTDNDSDITKFNGVSVKTDTMGYSLVIYAQY